jgi:hypothetical protein
VVVAVLVVEVVLLVVLVVAVAVLDPHQEMVLLELLILVEVLGVEKHLLVLVQREVQA